MFTFTITANSMAELIAILKKHADQIDAGTSLLAPAIQMVETSAPIPAYEAPAKPKRAKKEAPAPVVEDTDFSLDEPVAEEIETAAVTQMTTEDLIKKFQEYAKAHSREAAAKILTKMKVKSVREIMPNQIEQVLALLSK